MSESPGLVNRKKPLRPSKWDKENHSVKILRSKRPHNITGRRFNQEKNCYRNKLPIAFSSETLIRPETRYSNIERKILIPNTMYKGTEWLNSDGKPLELIALKNLAQASAKWARMLLKVEDKSWRSCLDYYPGKTVSVTDCLWRASFISGMLVKGIDLNIHILNQHLNASHTRLQTVKEETARDPTLNKLTKIFTTGWLADRSSCQYAGNSKSGGVLLKGNQIIIPVSLQLDLLQQLRLSHQGIEKKKRQEQEH